MIKPRLEGLTPRDMTSSFLFTSFGEVTKLLPAPYVFMISPRVVGKNDLWRDQPPYIDITPSYRQGPYGHLSKTWSGWVARNVCGSVATREVHHIHVRSFLSTTLCEIIKTYGVGRSFVTSPKDVKKHELMYSSRVSGYLVCENPYI